MIFGVYSWQQLTAQSEAFQPNGLMIISQQQTESRNQDTVINNLMGK